VEAPFKPYSILIPRPGTPRYEGTYLVLDWDEKANVLLWMRLPKLGEVKGHPNRMPRYLHCPQEEVFDQVVDAVLEMSLIVLHEPKKAETPDSDLIALAETPAARERLLSSIQKKNVRYAAIKPLLYQAPRGIGDDDSDPAQQPPGRETEPPSTKAEVHRGARRRPLDIFQDPELPVRVGRLAKKHGVSAQTFMDWLYRFFAGKENLNALAPGYTRCGNPGIDKPQRAPLGRKRDPRDIGPTNPDPYQLSDTDKLRLGTGYRLIDKHTKPRRAYALIISVFWADHFYDPETGKTTFKVFPVHRRPSFAQFMRWGAEMKGLSVADMLRMPHERAQRETRGRDEQDRVSTLGSVAYFDATSTDTYLTRIGRRLKPLPAMTRSILEEGISGIWYGLYCGWDGPSPATALQCILNGADPDKIAKWNEEFDLEIPEDAIPSMLCDLHYADCGELKAAEITEAEGQFKFSIEYASPHRGEKKGPVESSHHASHKALDHEMPGSTHGRQARHGEKPAVRDALFDRKQYMRELLLYIVYHNCVEEVDYAPPEMQARGIPPTRINIYKWYKRKNGDFSLPYNFESLRALCLPKLPAVIRKRGVHLKVRLSNHTVILPRFRYWSQEFANTGIFAELNKSGRSIDTYVRIDKERPSECFISTTAGMFKLFNRRSDTLFNRDYTLTDYLDLQEELRRGRLRREDDRLQIDAETAVRRKDMELAARAEKKAQAREAPEEATAKASRGALKANLADEIAEMQGGDENNSRNSKSAAAPVNTPVLPPPTTPSAVDRAMAAYLEGP
jgi:F0F1-type ATP synthase epsilon subunit